MTLHELLARDIAIVALHQSYETALASKGHKLTYPQMVALVTVADQITKGADFRIMDTAALIGCSRGNLTGVFDRLERGGYLVRENSKVDRRVIHIRLTTSGRALVPVIREILGIEN